MQQPFSQSAQIEQSYSTAGGQLSSTIGQGTTNQQRLKPQVFQFIGKMRKDSEVFYRKFALFCKSHKDTEKWNEFHSGVGQLIRPYGDLINEFNKMLHSDYQYDLPEQINSTLRNSEIGVDGQQEDEKRKNGNNISQTSLTVKEKFAQICQTIKQECPDKMDQFVYELQKKLVGKEDQLKLFIKTFREIFSEDLPIYRKVKDMFKDQMDPSQQDEISQQESQQNASMLLGSELPVKGKESILKGYRKRNYPSQPLNSFSASNKESQVNTAQQLKNTHPSNGYSFNQSINYKKAPVRGCEEQTPSMSRQYIDGFEGQDFSAQHLQKNILGTKSEQTFLYLIEKHMDSLAFMNMLKLLYLYIESIITASEMVEQGSYLLKGFQNSDKFIDQLRDLVECRENSRRKATPFFKPLNDLDFNNHSRFTHSYVEMPRFYPKNCSNSTELTKSVLNTSIVTVPQGTEHVTFSIMRKNQYEEQLFKSEDEKYEFDLQIQMYRRTIKILEQIKQKEDLTECKKLMQLALDLKIIPFLYKNGSTESQEICDILLCNPTKTVQVTLDRVKAKLKEIEDVKGTQAKKQWHEVAEKNFHRSLDHRSFIFKRHDRKFTLGSRFEKEPEFRNKMLQIVSNSNQQKLLLQLQQQRLISNQQQHGRNQGMKGTNNSNNNKSNNNNPSINTGEEGIENQQDFEADPACYFQFLNSFQGTTNIEKCSHSESEKYLPSFDYLNEPRKFVMPMMIFLFEDQNICEDTYSLLMHYIINTTMNSTEREKVKKTVQTVLKGLFGFQFSLIEQNDIILNENKIIKVVTDIENKIFEKIFAYLRPITREEDIKDQEEQDQDEEDKEDKAQQEEQEEQDQKPEKESATVTKGKKSTKSPSRQYQNKRNHINNNKDETENEDDKKNNKQENSESNLDEILDEEGSRESIREMSYCQEKLNENIYLPKWESEDTQTFYGTKCLYIFLRFFYVLYERLYKAAEISRSFEDNEKTQLLSEEEKQELAKERYITFKNILVGSLKTRDTKYEDYLRSIFGKQAFLLFTIDKTLQSTTKSLQALASDDLSTKLLSIYVNSDDFKQKPTLNEKEEIIYAKINKIILDSTVKQSNDQRNFFRFTKLNKSKILFLNYIDCYYKNWEIDQIQKTKEYFNEYITSPTTSRVNRAANSENPVYLSRNKRKNEDKQIQKLRKVVQINNIEYVANTNTNFIMSSNNGKEDVLLATKRKAIPIEQAIHVEINKKIKFDQWYSKQKQSLIQFKHQN